MKNSSFVRIISFLQGASWAFVLIGAALVFKALFLFDLPTAIFATFVFIFLALFLIAILDALIIHRKRYDEAKKQTKLLEEIHTKLESISSD
jgi:uncharacterized membrane protein